MLANSLYYRKIKACVQEAKTRYPDSTTQLSYVTAKGGTSRTAAVIAISAVAIVGLLAGIAVPAYRDYGTRVKVEQALTAVEPLKQQLGFSWNQSKTVPRELDLRALRSSTAAAYIEDLRLNSNNGTITVVFGAFDERMNGKSIQWVPSGEAGHPIRWVCRNVNAVPAQLLPPSCRD